MRMTVCDWCGRQVENTSFVRKKVVKKGKSEFDRVCLNCFEHRKGRR